LGKISIVFNICALGKEENTSGEGGERHHLISVRKYYAADVFILPINLTGNTSSFGQAIWLFHTTVLLSV
jgi:hypothetical protein